LLSLLTTEAHLLGASKGMHSRSHCIIGVIAFYSKQTRVVLIVDGLIEWVLSTRIHKVIVLRAGLFGDDLTVVSRNVVLFAYSFY